MTWKTVRWYLLNIVMFLVMLAGVRFENQLCMNTLVFLVSVNFISHLIIFFANNTELYERVRKKGFPVSENVNIIYSFLFFCVLAAYGHFWLAGMEVFSFAIQHGIYFPPTTAEIEQ